MKFKKKTKLINKNYKNDNKEFYFKQNATILDSFRFQSFFYYVDSAAHKTCKAFCM